MRGNTLIGTDLVSDVGDLREAIDRSDFASVAELYGAPFLGSLKLRRQSVEFEEWILETRATLASMVELAMLQQSRELHEAGEHRSAALAAEQAWEIAIRDGFPSPDYFETYHRILASAGSPTANGVRTMAEEFGIALAPVEPAKLEPRTEINPEQTVTPQPNSFALEHPGAAAATQLFGCQDELNAIARSVASHNLTTVVGLGGGGKTRLTAEFFNSAAAQTDFPNRHWVDLRDIADHELVAPAIAASLGQGFENVAALADRLPSDEPVLLVLDNFEHVLEAASVVHELLEGNRALRVLVTSRLPLEVATESLVKLNGLSTTDHELDSPAEQLFVSSARRAGVGDDRLSGWSRAAIRDVCRSVGGNPLALEIAGGWAQILPPKEILEALSMGNELLDTPMVGELRSMQAVLSQSWSTLEEPEQHTLMLLAAFPGGCLTKEALKLEQLPIRSIGRLVQHSLARLHVEGRITLHPLIESHALAELENRPDLNREFRQVLSTWCQSFADSLTADPNGTQAKTLGPEIANFASAWAWNARQGAWELHRSTLGLLRQFFTESGRISEGRALFAMTADTLRADPSGPQDILAAALESLGWFQMVSGEVAAARTLLDEALALGQGGPPSTEAQILRSIGVLHIATGELDKGTTNLNAALALISDEPGPLAAALRYDLAQAHHFRGEREQASSAARLALEAGRASDNWTLIVRSYLLLADIDIESDPQRAVVLLNEGWVIAKEASLDHLAIYFPLVLGRAHLNLSEAGLAEKYFTDGLEAAKKVGQLTTMCANYTGRAEARLMGEGHAEAIEDLRTGIRLALKSGSGRYLMAAAVVSCGAAAIRSAQGARGAQGAQGAQIKELLSLTLHHPAADQDARAEAAKTWRELFGDVPKSVLDPTTVPDTPGLDEVAERSLELLTSPLA